ncbi:GNAT family N-acetyltransferase [Actinokineospora sp.]|uniref:GNAT family N-acetyltransferase n=1 Tax=Actinokineospora sp. TaxID=1872133 RepID=UPI0040382ED8
MDTAALDAFDQQLRRDLSPGDGHTAVERTARLTRQVSTIPQGWSGIVWSDLDEDTADAAIAAEVARFRGVAGFEWKHYHHDRPADLPARLLAAGLTAGPDEAVLVAEAAAVPDFAPPAGVTLLDVTDAAGIERAVDVHGDVFGYDVGGLRARLLAQLAAAPDTLDMVLAVAGDVAVSAARTEYYPGTEFAGLWGGGTLEPWRGKGIYKALVSHRARRAQARGARYLQVDALPTSGPILARVGFTRLTTTTPYTFG